MTSPRQAEPTTPGSTPTATSAVPTLTSPILTEAGFRHAFFTRAGGVSTGPFASLNLTTVTGDDPAHVDENLKRVAAALAVAPERVYFPSQVHGVATLEASEADDRVAFSKLEADNVIGGSPRLACAIRTADCVSVLVGALDTGWAAACHAGWKGCVAGVVLEAVRALRARGATRFVAAIGPHISREAFEVSPEVAELLERASPDPDVVDRTGEKPHVDLRRLVRAQLVSEGLADHSIDDVFGCTVREPARFFSFRRDGERSGRLISAIVPRGRA